MVLLLSALTALCLIGLVVGIDMFIYSESMVEVLYRIFIYNGIGKSYVYLFFFLCFSIAAIGDVQRRKKKKDKQT